MKHGVEGEIPEAGLKTGPGAPQLLVLSFEEAIAHTARKMKGPRNPCTNVILQTYNLMFLIHSTGWPGTVILNPCSNFFHLPVSFDSLQRDCIV